MIVVSDSTPLITLMKAARLDVLNELFGDVYIPETVYKELTLNEAFSDEADLIRASEFIKVVKVEKDESVTLLQRATGLDRGESEAIVYADDNHADLLLMDEAAGREVAQRMNIRIMGSVGVIISAVRSGFMTKQDAENAFEKIRAANRHISDRLLRDALDIINGK